MIDRAGDSRSWASLGRFFTRSCFCMFATCNPVQVRAVQVRPALKCSPIVKTTLLLISAKKNKNTGAILAVHPVPTPFQPVRPFRTGSGTVQAGDSRTGRDGRGLAGFFLLPFLSFLLSFFFSLSSRRVISDRRKTRTCFFSPPPRWPRFFSSAFFFLPRARAPCH